MFCADFKKGSPHCDVAQLQVVINTLQSHLIQSQSHVPHIYDVLLNACKYCEKNLAFMWQQLPLSEMGRDHINCLAVRYQFEDAPLCRSMSTEQNHLLLSKLHWVNLLLKLHKLHLFSLHRLTSLHRSALGMPSKTKLFFELAYEEGADPWGVHSGGGSVDDGA